MNKKRSDKNNISKEIHVYTNNDETTKITDTEQICREFNKFFVSNNIKARGNEKRIIDYPGPRVTNSIFIEPV